MNPLKDFLDNKGKTVFIQKTPEQITARNLAYAVSLIQKAVTIIENECPQEAKLGGLASDAFKISLKVADKYLSQEA